VLSSKLLNIVGYTRTDKIQAVIRYNLTRGAIIYVNLLIDKLSNFFLHSFLQGSGHWPTRDILDRGNNPAISIRRYRQSTDQV
jgi:hypothetical protein